MLTNNTNKAQILTFADKWEKVTNLLSKVLLSSPVVAQEFGKDPIGCLQKFGISIKDEKLYEDMTKRVKDIINDKEKVSSSACVTPVPNAQPTPTPGVMFATVEGTANQSKLISYDQLEKIFDVNLDKVDEAALGIATDR